MITVNDAIRLVRDGCFRIHYIGQTGDMYMSSNEFNSYPEKDALLQSYCTSILGTCDGCVLIETADNRKMEE